MLDEYELERSELSITLAGSRGTGAPDEGGDELFPPAGSRELYYEFWTEFLRSFDRNHQDGLRYSRAHHRNWQDIHAGLSGFHYVLRTVKDSSSVLGYFTGDQAKERSERIRELCGERIGEAFGADAVEWDSADDRKSCYVSITSTDQDISDREKWPRIISWLNDTLSKLSGIIGPYCGELKGPRE